MMGATRWVEARGGWALREGEAEAGGAGPVPAGGGAEAGSRQSGVLGRRRTLEQPIDEVGYLVAPDARHYRPIMRYFLEQHRQQRFFVGVEEVRRHVASRHDSGYTEDQCRADLEQLVAWGNLTRHYERTRVRTIEEFLRRQAVYQCTPEGIAVEEFVIGLDEEGRRVGSLDRTALEALLQRMSELDGLLGDPALLPAGGGEGGTAFAARFPSPAQEAAQGRVASLWREVRDHFERVAADGIGYLGALRNVQAQQILEHSAFMAYKDVLVRYLSTYAVALSAQGPRIAALCRAWAEGSRGAALVFCAAAVAARQPLPDGTYPDFGREAAAARSALEALSRWFSPAGDVERLKRTTNDAIELVTRQAARLAELRWGARSRRRELEDLALAFLHCREAAQAERVASVAFGAALPRHWRGDIASVPAEAGRASPWEEPAADVILVPVRAGSRNRLADDRVPELHDRRSALLAEGLARRREAAERLGALFRDGCLDLEDVRLPSVELRDELLDLVGRCLAAPDGRAQAADGGRVILELGEGLGRIAAPDGVVHAPRCLLRREAPPAAGRGGP
jgi:uncharacterized protein (TIGR02677 family)